jgi:hypothetical protein
MGICINDKFKNVKTRKATPDGEPPSAKNPNDNIKTIEPESQCVK